MRHPAQRAAAAVVCAFGLLLALPAPSATTKSRKPATSTGKQAGAKNTTRAADKAADPADPRAAQAEQSAERDRLTSRIAELRKQIAAGEKSRTGAAASLKRAEQSLALVNHRLDELARRQREGQERIAGLDRQRSGTETQIGRKQAAFASTATMLAVNQDRDPFHDAIVDGDAGGRTLDDLDLQAVTRSIASDLDGLHGHARDLQSQRQKADDDARALLAQADAQKTAREAIAADQAAQRKSLAQISEQLAQQRNTAAALAADEQRLTRVVEELQRTIERQAAQERARREAARRLAEQQAARRDRAATPRARAESPTSTGPTPPPKTIDAVPDVATGSGDFARLRGALRLPARGTLTGRFGAPRGTSGATWKGVFVRTESGADVHAVAAGRVVFADDLRGFGNLVIVDHGDQYLSIYGNNESLLKKTGDVVKPGDVVAHAGNSSGDEQTGLYFELRHQGRPFDPMSWAGGR